MPVIQKTVLETYRRRTFYTETGHQLKSEEDAVRFVEQHGFIFFWPIQGFEYPSLWTAVAGDRPVASEHDDPGHVTWGWKDNLLPQKRWYYGKILRGKSTMISLAIAPAFYALSENYGDPEIDYLEQYRDGRLSQGGRLIFESLLNEGPLDSISLRRKAQMSSQASKSAFERTLVELQRDFKILPVGISDKGGWRYSFIFDLVHRYFPEIPGAAEDISTQNARIEIALAYFRNMGAASAEEINRLLAWRMQDTRRTLKRLVDENKLEKDIQITGKTGEFYALPELIS
jgi:DNA glycosylase AlkZ-like